MRSFTNGPQTAKEVKRKRQKKGGHRVWAGWPCCLTPRAACTGYHSPGRLGRLGRPITRSAGPHALGRARPRAQRPGARPSTAMAPATRRALGSRVLIRPRPGVGSTECLDRQEEAYDARQTYDVHGDGLTDLARTPSHDLAIKGVRLGRAVT
jgi:hypothetical protein